MISEKKVLGKMVLGKMIATKKNPRKRSLLNECLENLPREI